MERSGIKKYLQVIAINYPSYKKHIESENGIPEMIITEWHRQIGFLDYDEALARLDAWMGSESGSRIPKPADIKNMCLSRRDSEVFYDKTPHQWHLEFTKGDKTRMHGRLFDEEGREYSHDPLYADRYHYDKMGRICTIDGRVVCARG